MYQLKLCTGLEMYDWVVYYENLCSCNLLFPVMDPKMLLMARINDRLFGQVGIYNDTVNVAGQGNV